MSREDDIAIAAFAAQIGGELKAVDSMVSGKGSIPKNTLDPRAFLPSGGIAPSIPTPIPTTSSIEPRPLSELLIPMPQASIPPQAPISPTPQVSPTAQLEFAFAPGTQNKIPETPREMFEYFDDKIKDITDILQVIKCMISEVKSNTTKRRRIDGTTTKTND